MVSDSIIDLKSHGLLSGTFKSSITVSGAFTGSWRMQRSSLAYEPSPIFPSLEATCPDQFLFPLLPRRRLVSLPLPAHVGAPRRLGRRLHRWLPIPQASAPGISSASLRALFTAKVSKPFFTSPYSGNDALRLRVGPSAHLSGTALEFAKSGAVIDLISYDANAQYASNAKHISGDVYTPLGHVGSRAFFVYLASFPQAPAVYAQQGGLFCSVDLNIDNSNEVGLPSSSPARVAPGMEAELAKKEFAVSFALRRCGRG